MSDHTLQHFKSGVHNLINPELIPIDAAQDSTGWLTKDGKLVLSYGRIIVGNDTATIGKICGLWFGYKTDGTQVMYRKISTKIQYLNGSTWTDIITGLTSNSDYTFANYSSLAGSFTFIGGEDGLWKINNANPTSPISMTPTGGVYKGKIMIDKGRLQLWARKESKTTVFWSYVDVQKVGTNYTVVSGEVTGSSGTLAFKAGGATRNCFGVVITVTGTGEKFTDNYLGTLVGSLGHTGTINYATGAYVLTTGGGAGTATYSWEDSNIKGLTDFSSSATRLASEGMYLQQDAGGDAILNILVGPDGEYYSIKTNSVYRVTSDVNDLLPINILFRQNLGIQSFRAAISTNKGIVFMNTANPSKPEMTILQKSLVTNNVEPVTLFPHFKFANYDYSDCSINTWERYFVVLCKTLLSSTNDTVLLCDMSTGSVDIVSYAGRCSVSDLSGNFYVGHPLTENVYKIFNGFDDVGLPVTNYWISKSDQYMNSVGLTRTLKFQIGERLKKFRKEKIKGTISLAQKLEVYIDCDGSGWQLIGTVLGTGDYVDYSSPQSLGSNMVGQSQMGGDDSVAVAYPFFTELKAKVTKFRTRKIKIIATGIGYVDIDMLSDWDLMIFEQRLPTRFRQKQNVSLDGVTHDIPQS